MFNEELWERLVSYARITNTSVGDLVRRAVEQVYPSVEKQKRINKAYQTILSLRRRHKKIDYKELINYGRRR